MKILKLYSTLGCHLCEHALAMVVPIAKAYDFQVREIEISDSNDLIQKYGVVIPVLEWPEANKSLHWPFSAEDVQELLAENL